MSRQKPYTTNQESWNTILQKNLRIPMNQREYSIINLNYNGINDIYDGQQRILTTILILNVIGCLSPKLKDSIINLLTVDTVLYPLTLEQKKIKEKCNVDMIPKIFCINPTDMLGLVDIFNNKVKSWAEYLHDIEDIYNEDEIYSCNKCKYNTKLQYKSRLFLN